MKGKWLPVLPITYTPNVRTAIYMGWLNKLSKHLWDSSYQSTALCYPITVDVDGTPTLKSEAAWGHRHCTAPSALKRWSWHRMGKGRVLPYICKDKSEVRELQWSVQFFSESVRDSETAYSGFLLLHVCVCWFGFLNPASSSVVQ